MENSSFLIAIAVGAISGVVAAALLWLVKYLFTQHFLPFYQSITYQGSSIDGRWAAFEINEDGNREPSPFATIQIKQSAHRISATYIMHLKTGEGDLSFDCQGEYWEGYLSMRGRSYLRTNYSILTALMRLRDSGAAMQGDVSMRHRAEDRAFTQQGVVFERA